MAHAFGMDGPKTLLVILCLAALGQGWLLWEHRPVHPADGILAPSDPVQTNLETVPLIQVTNLSRTLRWLKEREIWLVGADDQAPTTMYQADLKGRLAVVLGAEGQGLRRLTQENCDLLVRIPMNGVVESLNVSVASGVLLFEALRQRT